MGLQVKILKGTKQIGGCITEISTDKSKIIIDFGEDLPDDNVKTINKNPNIVGLTSGKSTYDAVFITHSHGDHIGLINYINKDIPVYVEQASKSIYEMLSDFTYKDSRKKTVPMEFNKSYEEGDFKVTPYKVDHSSYNSSMFLIECEGKRILHTGDYRSHGINGKDFLKTIESIGHVDMIITEGTSLCRNDKEKYMTEEELSCKAEEIFKEYDQVFILQSSTNIDRICSFYKAAQNTGKNFIEDVFTSNITCSLGNSEVPNPKAFDDVYTWIPVKYKRKSEEFKEKYINGFKSRSKQKSYRDKKYVLMVKTTMLKDIEKLYNKGYITNAVLIYSMWEGYKDRKEMIKFLDEVKKYRLDSQMSLHTSGHADMETIRLLNKLGASKVVAIHTTNQAKLKELLNNVVLIKDEEVLEV